MRLPPPVDTEESLLAAARDLRERFRKVFKEKRARQAWADVNAVRRGRIPGERTYADPEKLLAIYDALRTNPNNNSYTREEIAREIAEAANKHDKFKFGSTVIGITKTITRSLKERERLLAEERAYADRLAALVADAAKFQAQVNSISPLVAALLGDMDKKTPGLLSGGHEIPGK